MTNLAHIGEIDPRKWRYNTEGSQESMITLRARKNQCLVVSQEQQDILIGCILGDAYIEKRGKIQIEHSSNQEAYIRWKYERLKSISYGPPSRVARFDPRYGTSYESLRFWTRQFFREWRERFYPKGNKVFPKDLNRLSPLAMAVWYMDDGSLDSGSKIILSTDAFSDADRQRIQNVLENSFGITSHQKSNGKLLVGTRETRLLAHIMRPHIVPSMRYKIP